jgi:hypothetical protein
MIISLVVCFFLIVNTQSSKENPLLRELSILNSSVSPTNLDNASIKQNRYNHTHHQNDSHHHHHSFKELKRKSKITYDKVLPCINVAWMMKSWAAINFTFPQDAEEHYKDLNNRAARFRRARVHAYANYSGLIIKAFIYTCM